VSEIDRQKARSKSASLRIGESAENTALDATEAHIEVLRFRKLVSIAEANVEVHRGYVGRVTERTQSGAGTADEIAQAQARLEQAQALLAENQQGLRDAEALYIKTVGDMPGELDEVTYPTAMVPADLDNALKLLPTNPTVKITGADVEPTIKPFVGKVIDVGQAVVGGDTPIACKNAQYSSAMIPPNGLFQGGLAGLNAEAQAKSLGLSPEEARTVTLNCDTGLYDFHFVSRDEALIAYDHVIFRLGREK